MTSPVSSHLVDEKFHEKEKGDISFDDNYGRINRSCDYGNSMGYIRVDDGRRGYRSKETSQFSSHNTGETGGGDGIGG